MSENDRAEQTKQPEPAAPQDTLPEKQPDLEKPETDQPGKQPAPVGPQDSFREKHLQKIREQLEEAKDPASYETYDFCPSLADAHLKLFTARRRGFKHIDEKTSCQDYCFAAALNGCTILADADGVSSCEHSDIGSRLACEAVVRAVEAASQNCNDEEQMANRLLSVAFRERLVSYWVNSVLSEISKDGSAAPEDQLTEFSKYGTTILFAVLTENWIVAGNLGDGQVLVFNDSFGVKLREHLPKYSSKVRSLVNPKCAREDFHVAKYPRSVFNGVLLTTDGIYESLENGSHFFQYAVQMKKRFLERTPNEPYQAFCYEEEGEPYKDFSRMRTQDDCSIAMALDDREIISDFRDVVSGILLHADALLFKNWSSECMAFLTQQGDALSNVIVSGKTANLSLPETLESAVWEAPAEVWTDENRQYVRYKNTELLPLGLMQSSGMLRLDRNNPEESGQMIIDLYLKIKKLQKELNDLGLALNTSAMFNLLYDLNGQTLHIRKEAVSRVGTEPAAKGSFNAVENCFSHLLGVLGSGETKVPVFDIGYLDRGSRLYRAGSQSESLALLLRADKKMCLKNVSSAAWTVEDGRTIQPGESLELSEKLSFTLQDTQGAESETYTYISKGLL